jgi:hypothetical protein
VAKLNSSRTQCDLKALSKLYCPPYPSGEDPPRKLLWHWVDCRVGDQAADRASMSFGLNIFGARTLTNVDERLPKLHS